MDSPSTLDSRLAFLRWTDEDRARLAELEPMLEENADAFVREFYGHLLGFPPTRALLADPEVRDRLLSMQRAYLVSLAGPEIDPGYVEERVRIGATHVRIALDPRWYLGAHALYLRLLVPKIIDHFHGDAGRAEKTIDSLIKLLMLDAQLAMEAYIERRERQLAYSNEELARFNQELSHDVDEQRSALRTTMERVHAAEELASVAALVAGLAHEVATPMGVIRGHAELLEPALAEADERSRWRLTTIREQIDRIQRIIETLLNMTRRERHPTEVSLIPLVESSLEFLRERLEDARIEVALELAPDDPIVIRGDPEKLQQLLLNLMLNAIDAMPKGGRLSVSLARHADRVDLYIGDEGHGIAPDVIDRVFEPFYTTKPLGQGSGLGLMVARQIAREHGGDIALESDPGQGTRIRVTLPIGA